jgi:hypothetical protein
VRGPVGGCIKPVCVTAKACRTLFLASVNDFSFPHDYAS